MTKSKSILRWLLKIITSIILVILSFMILAYGWQFFALCTYRGGIFYNPYYFGLSRSQWLSQLFVILFIAIILGYFNIKSFLKNDNHTALTILLLSLMFMLSVHFYEIYLNSNLITKG